MANMVWRHGRMAGNNYAIRHTGSDIKQDLFHSGKGHLSLRLQVKAEIKGIVGEFPLELRRHECFTLMVIDMSVHPWP